MPKRTIYGQRIYNKIQGFQYLIKHIKKEELDRILELNPDYLFDILPYAYQLGVAEELYELIEKRKMAKPEWFVMDGKFSYPRLNNSILKLKEILTTNKED